MSSGNYIGRNVTKMRSIIGHKIVYNGVETVGRARKAGGEKKAERHLEKKGLSFLNSSRINY